MAAQRRKTGKLLALLLALCFVMAAGCAKQNGAGGESDPAQAQEAAPAAKDAARVSVATVENRPFEWRVEVQGTLSAKNYANVSARIPGTLTGIFVNEGDTVIKGKTKLFAVDSIKLQNALEISRQDYAVAEQGVNVAKAAIELVDAQLRKVEVDLERLKGLYKNEVVSKDDLEKAQTGFDQVVAGKKQAVSSLALAEERQKQAGIALKIAEKNLSDATIYAPINGRVAVKSAEVGEMAAPGQPVVRIEDTSLLEASAFLPSEYFGKITEGETEVALIVAGTTLPVRVVSYKSPTINPKLRTFEVKALVDNPDSATAPGAMVSFAAVMDRREGPGVPSDSLQVRGGKNTVFEAQGDKAVLREVETGYEMEGYTEILGGGIKPGARVIVKGQSFVDEGDEISISGEAE